MDLPMSTHGVKTSGLVVAVLLALCATSRAADKSTPPKADRIVIAKSTHTLTLLSHGAGGA